MMKLFLVLLPFLPLIFAEYAEKIDLKLTLPKDVTASWLSNVEIYLDGGKYIAHVKNDGSFSFFNIPPGSYHLEVVCPQFIYQKSRVEISAQGKVRFRASTVLKPSDVKDKSVTQPFNVKLLGYATYFERRDEWSITSVLKSPMVIFMVLPLILFAIMPNMKEDPEMQEIQKKMNSVMQGGVSELFSGASGDSSTAGAKKPKKIKHN